MDPLTVTKFTQAIVRRPCPEMTDGITTARLGIPDYQLAMLQHNAYVEALRSLGLKVTVLEEDNRYPDSTFVEDVALCTPAMAVVTSPGALSRRGEEQEMEQVLRRFYDQIESIVSPGTLDAGDVMMAGIHYFIGISQRTSEIGADQLIGILEKYGLTGEKVEVGSMLHLKTGAAYLENDTVLVAGPMANHRSLSRFRKIIVPKGEEYAANAVWINGTVLVPDGFPRTRDLVEAAGYPVLQVPVSEYQKLDGGLSCLSLRF
jgi:dimethylargininase